MLQIDEDATTSPTLQKKEVYTWWKVPVKCSKNCHILYIWKWKVAFSIFHFVLHTLFFPLMNALVYVNIDQDIHQGKNEIAGNETWKKQLWVFVYIKYGKCWSLLLELFINHKPLFSEEWSLVNIFTEDDSDPAPCSNLENIL